MILNEKRLYTCYHCPPAGTGFVLGDYSLTYDADGSVICPCRDVIGIGQFKAGSLDGGIDEGVIAGISALTCEAKPGCAKCWARYICGGGCFYQSYYATGDIAKPDEVMLRTDQACHQAGTEIPPAPGGSPSSSLRDDENTHNETAPVALRVRGMTDLTSFSMTKTPPNHLIHAGTLSDDRLVRAAQRFGTPIYVYDACGIERKWTLLKAGLPGGVDVFYSVKANPSLAVIQRFAELGADFEVVSIGELAAVRHVGVHPSRVIFRWARENRSRASSCRGRRTVCTGRGIAARGSRRGEAGRRPG